MKSQIAYFGYLVGSSIILTYIFCYLTDRDTTFFTITISAIISSSILSLFAYLFACLLEKKRPTIKWSDLYKSYAFCIVVFGTTSTLSVLSIIIVVNQRELTFLIVFGVLISISAHSLLSASKLTPRDNQRIKPDHLETLETPTVKD